MDLYVANRGTVEDTSPKQPQTPVQPCPPTKKTLKLRIVIVKGSYWDSEEGRKKIAKQIAEAERVLGINIKAEPPAPYETIDDDSLKNVPSGKWDDDNHYSQEEVNLINKLGTDDTPAMVFTDEGDGDAITVSKAWAGKNDGLNKEGVIVDKGSKDDDLVVTHELGHLLSGESGDNTHSDDKDNVMYPYTGQRGDEWTDPWKSSAEKNSYLK
jgi:hypothetical protein